MFQKYLNVIHLKLKLFYRIAFISILLLLMILPLTVRTANAQPAQNYFVTVNPTTPDSIMYTTVGRNWTVSFEAFWTYGENSGTAIQNATVTIQVNNTKNKTIDTLQLNTTYGVFSFNYSSSTAEKLNFTATKLVTTDGIEFKSELDKLNNVYGLQSKPMVVWWDTFLVSLVNSNANTLGTVYVSVNVTYLLLPEEGLTLPEWATYSNQTFLPKIAHNLTVTINGVKAQETSIEGIYEANVSIWLPTAYILVGVSQERWITTFTGFSFAQNANETLWKYSTASGLGLFSVAIVLFFIFSQKSKGHISSKKNTYAFLGGVLLIISSLVSVYWGLVGLDSTLHGFAWLPLTLLGFLSFGIGSIAGYLSLKRKKQALIILAVVLSLFTNLFGIKFSLDIYGLASPWLIIIPSFALSAISGLLICSADEVFA